MKQLKGDAQEFINRSKHRRCISSILQLNRNSIEFSLLTQTRRVIKSPQAKSLQVTQVVEIVIKGIDLLEKIRKSKAKDDEVIKVVEEIK